MTRLAIILFFMVSLLVGCSPNTVQEPAPSPPPNLEQTIVERTELTQPTTPVEQPPKQTIEKKQAGPTIKIKQPKPIDPVKLEIPSIKVNTAIVPVGVQKNGQMGVPKQFDKVGILAPWTRPGEKGNAVIAGHFDHYTGPAVFYRLRQLKPGDLIYVKDNKGSNLAFRINRVESFPTAKAPLKDIFGPVNKSQLNLITCSGKFNKKTQEHAQRLVVFSELID